MHGGDMIQQTMLMHSFLSDKDVLFLGDGDGMSMMFGLFATQGLTSKPKSLTVLDFDERMVNNIDKFSKDFEFSVPVKASIYNVIDKTDPDLRQKFDFFYINPPYGSKNKGLSTIVGYIDVWSYVNKSRLDVWLYPMMRMFYGLLKL